MGSNNISLSEVTLIGGNITGTGTLTVTDTLFLKSGTISVALAGNAEARKATSGTATLSGTNTYTGGTYIDGGVLCFAEGSLGSDDWIEFVGTATLQWASGNTQDISSRIYIDRDKTATIDTSDNTVTFANATSGAGSLIKAGTGTLVVTAALSCSSVAVNAGTLQIGNGGTSGSVASSTGQIQLQDSATLVLDRSDTIAIDELIYGTGSVRPTGHWQVGPQRRQYLHRHDHRQPGIGPNRQR